MVDSLRIELSSYPLQGHAEMTTLAHCLYLVDLDGNAPPYSTCKEDVLLLN